MNNDAVTCFSFSDRIDLGPTVEHSSAVSDGLRANLDAVARLALGDSCECCGSDGEVVGGMFGELVLCAACKAADEGGA